MKGLWMGSLLGTVKIIDYDHNYVVRNVHKNREKFISCKYLKSTPGKRQRIDVLTHLPMQRNDFIRSQIIGWGKEPVLSVCPCAYQLQPWAF